MRNILRTLRITMFLIVGLFLFYVMPQQDIARIVDTDSRLTTLSGVQSWFYAQEDTGSNEGAAVPFWTNRPFSKSLTSARESPAPSRRIPAT